MATRSDTVAERSFTRGDNGCSAERASSTGAPASTERRRSAMGRGFRARPAWGAA
eukprot:CAMPEP_0170417292 /NCGR_PEP_ID=MMETSP0117_2-20130122/33625_1 /TAXON_ID=400756 /ORGANISM="Durinskia baltica, Strain CSIRO CS-38" /LENGTH=54 /DNA_ID=CAMNT_0010675441 /DNA_START=21 /DNA_END=181 /DNA_ORIENTATION=-